MHNKHMRHMTGRMLLRLQDETGITRVADPWGGSFFMEHLTATHRYQKRQLFAVLAHFLQEETGTNSVDGSFFVEHPPHISIRHDNRLLCYTTLCRRRQASRALLTPGVAAFSWRT
jgi:hypothetical protein